MPSTQALPEALSAARRSWLEAANASDPGAYAEHLAEDAVWLPPGLPAIEGRHAIHRWLAETMASLSYDLTLEDVEIRLADGWASETGRFLARMTDETTGRAMEHEGGYLILWSEAPEGRWRIDRYVDLTELEETPA